MDMFDEGKTSWTDAELEEIYAWEQEAHDKGESCISRCRNCCYWFCNQVVSPYCDTCLTLGLEGGRQAAREPAEQEEARWILRRAARAREAAGQEPGREDN
jgi:hypothetical protein